MKKQLPKIIDVNKEKCINCHACILACPVKYCNDGSGDHVNVNFDLCIGCGSCLVKCTHNARIYLDDFREFLSALDDGEKVVAIVAPSIAANFPNSYLNLNGWLISKGVEAVFDVSFGAELTIYSYLNYIQEKKPELVIAQPCPAIVTYIEIYQPELLEYLVPIDSPMLHTMKMIKQFYTKYKNHKIAVISPCSAKKREFIETGYGDYNVAYKSLDDFFKNNNINLNDYEALDYNNPPAERAVLFSSPGGLTQTAERWIPDIRYKTRKIEGANSIYNYLRKLPDVIELGSAPLLIDCLNCENGCNAGSLTLVKDKSIDEIEYYINKRNLEQQKVYLKNNDSPEHDYKEEIENLIKENWKEGLYKRTYSNLSKNYNIKEPSEKELWAIYNKMRKYSQADILNCTSCGYETCKRMATAIFNNLNRPENCHFYLNKETEISHEETIKSQKRLKNILESTSEGFIQIDKKGIVVEANPTLKKLFEDDDIVGKSVFEFLDENNKDILLRQLSLREQKFDAKYELEIITRSGERISCLLSATNIYDDNGERIGSFAMVSNITELKKAEETIQNSEKKFRALFEDAIIGIFIMRDDLIIECNKKGLEMFGCSSEQMIGKTLLNYSPEHQPDDSNSKIKFSSYLEIALANKKPTFYWLFKRRDKTKFDAEVSLAKIILSDEVFIQVVIRDITLRMKAERELKKYHDELEKRVLERTAELSETIEELKFTKSVIDDYNAELEKLSVIASQTDNAVLVLETNGDLVWANTAYENIFGYQIFDYLSKGLRNYADISNYPNIKRTIEKCVEKKETQIFESKEIRNDNTEIWVQNTLSPITNTEKIVYQLVCISSDITKIKEAEAEIIRQKEEIGVQRDQMERKAEELTETLENLKKTQNQLINSEKMAALGQLISGVAHEINTPLGAIRSSIENIDTTLKTVLTELPEFFLSISPEIRQVFMNMIRISFGNEMIITAKEERKIKKEVVKKLDDMKISDSHKLAEILTEMGILDNFKEFESILNHPDKTRLMNMAFKLSGILRSSNIISSATERASKVVFALKSYAHFNTSDKPVFANIKDSLETVLTLYYNKIKYGVKLTRNYIDTPQIECYPDDLNQAWTNLIHNALQAMEYKGTLLIQTKLHGEYLVVTITDSGKGIPDEIKARIFDPFFTTKPMGEGSGLGLDIVQKIIKKHNGIIKFESKPGKTNFEIFLPLKINDVKNDK